MAEMQMEGHTKASLPLLLLVKSRQTEKDRCDLWRVSRKGDPVLNVEA